MTEENTETLKEQEDTIVQEELLDETQESSSTEPQEETVEETVEEPAIKVTETEEYQEMNNKYLRLHAEFDNYRRRTARENLELVERANAKVLSDLCEVVENFDRAIETEAGAEAHEDFVKGIRLIADQFNGILKNHGLEVINPEGLAFDPNEHEAMMQQPSEDVEPDHVLQVFQKGYKVKDKVIRHAKVIVSAGS